MTHDERVTRLAEKMMEAMSSAEANAIDAWAADLETLGTEEPDAEVAWRKALRPYAAALVQLETALQHGRLRGHEWSRGCDGCLDAERALAALRALEAK